MNSNVSCMNIDENDSSGLNSLMNTSRAGRNAFNYAHQKQSTSSFPIEMVDY